MIDDNIMRVIIGVIIGISIFIFAIAIIVIRNKNSPNYIPPKKGGWNLGDPGPRPPMLIPGQNKALPPK